ncbi:MAG: dTDP-glucose 4,6-dehydratase [Dehalococcoidia bacterium]|nr:dTDP-glucose 4,6-dehydratase [Dehalococcoidia bacterium]
MRRFLVSGGAGFIGSNFVRHLLNAHPDYHVTVLDKLTYAGNLDNLLDVQDNPRYRFIKGDICDAALVGAIHESPDRPHVVVNFAAESHVDRSLLDPGSFLRTDVQGTYVLLEAARKHVVELFLQISTDEVYGSILEGSFKETDPLNPSSPYAASKAGGDMLALAYHTSFGLPVVITRSSNNFGPYQYPEKFIPLFVTNAIDGEPLPLYGDGLQVRDWLYVLDNCRAIDLVIHQGAPGEVYNVGASSERVNLEVAEGILRVLGKPRELVRHVTDRPGHDRRYSLDSAKLRSLGWAPSRSHEEAMEETVRWYFDNQWWWRKIKSGEFLEYYRQNYGERLRGGQPLG